MRQPILCHRWPAWLTKTVLSSGLLAFILVSCTPWPKPTPQMRLGGNKLHVPLVMASPYRWQRLGYGRPWQTLNTYAGDAVLHHKGMWAYTWALGDCLADVPMVWGAWLPDRVTLAKCANLSPVILVLNEPEWGSQANVTPEEAATLVRALAEFWPDGIYCCGTHVSHSGWFARFVDAYIAAYRERPPLAGVHLHVYVADGLPVDSPADPGYIAQSQAQLATYLETIRKYELPARVVVSECCLLSQHSDAVYLDVMESYVEMLESFDEVESIAWFSARFPPYPSSDLLKRNGQPTALGERWLALRWE